MMNLLLTAEKFKKKVTFAREGDKLCYFVGNLATTAEFNSNVKDLANAAWDMAHKPISLGTLVQRKSNEFPGKYEYFFIKNKNTF